jgi:hypothetical protein
MLALGEDLAGELVGRSVVLDRGGGSDESVVVAAERAVVLALRCAGERARRSV